MHSIITLTKEQFTLGHDIFSLTIDLMGAAALFFFFSRDRVLPRFRTALLLAGISAALGCYHYIQIFHSWNEAFEFAGNSYIVSGHLFHETYRSLNWLLAMPLLLVAFVLILARSKDLTISLIRRLVNASIVMIAFGYFGKMAIESHAVMVQWVWWFLGMIPFVYIMMLLWRLLSPAFENQSACAHKLIKQARNLILISWSFYPLATLLGLLHVGVSATGLVVFNIGYSLADIAAIGGLGLYITWIAMANSERNSQE